MLLSIHISPVEATPAAFYESRNDHYRTGANLAETILNHANVSSSNFGLLFNLPLDVGVGTQTLYAPNLVIQNTVHNVIYVTTYGGTIYAFDADQAGPPLGLLKPGVSGTNNILNNTPIIDPTTNTLYLLTRQINPTPPYNMQLHALDLTSGAEKFGGPVTLKGSYTSPSGSKVDFDGQNLKSHAGLALANGQLIITFCATHEGSAFVYSGWVMSYNATTLQQTGVFATITLPPATGGGIWQSGRAPAVDDQGNIYLFTGNAYSTGDYTNPANSYDGVNNFSESLLKFNANLQLLDWFTPSDWSFLDKIDADLSSSGPTIIPGTGLIVGGGKDGNLYLWDSKNLGRYDANDAQVIQKIPGPLGADRIFNGPVFWSRSAEEGGGLLFNAYWDSPIYAFAFNGTTLNPTPIFGSPAADAARGGYKTSFALSANGGQKGTGVIWALIDNPTTKTSILHAYNAENLAQELWSSGNYPLSEQLQGRGTYIPPTVINGKVYVPTSANMLSVFGLQNQNSLPKLFAIPNTVITVGTPINYKVPASSAQGGNLIFSSNNLPPGLSINSNTGLISGAASTVGVYKGSITVTDTLSGSRTTSFQCTVKAGG